MPLDTAKALRGENKRLRALNAKQAAQNEMMSSQLKNHEQALATRRSEVAILHQACAKYKRARRQQPSAAINTTSPIKEGNRPTSVHVPSPPTVIFSLDCPQIDERLSVALAEIERLKSALAEKETLISTLADKDRKAEARRTKIAVFIDETIVSSQEKRERVEREMAEMKRQDERDNDEFRVQGQQCLVARLTTSNIGRSTSADWQSKCRLSNVVSIKQRYQSDNKICF